MSGSQPRTRRVLASWRCQADRHVNRRYHATRRGRRGYDFLDLPSQTLPHYLQFTRALSDGVWMEPPSTLAFQRLVDFRSYRPLCKSDVPSAFESRRKRQKSTKVGHWGCYRLPRSRVCGVLLGLLHQGIMCALSTVADNRKSANAEGWNGRMACLCDS